MSSAANLALTWPGTRVELCFPGDRPLPPHHARVWVRIARRLDGLGVVLRAGRRAVVPDGFVCDPFRFQAWSVDRVLQPWIVRRAIYRGMRPSSSGD